MVYRVVKTDAYLPCYISICSTLLDTSVLYRGSHKLREVENKRGAAYRWKQFYPGESGSFTFNYHLSLSLSKIAIASRREMKSCVETRKKNQAARNVWSSFNRKI